MTHSKKTEFDKNKIKMNKQYSRHGNKKTVETSMLHSCKKNPNFQEQNLKPCPSTSLTKRSSELTELSNMIEQ